MYMYITRYAATTAIIIAAATFIVPESQSHAQPTTSIDTPSTAPAASPLDGLMPTEQEVVMAMATARRRMKGFKELKDLGAQRELLQQALIDLSPALTHPTDQRVEAWLLAGAIASLNNDKDLAAWAAEAIARLMPNYHQDDTAKNVMVELFILSTPELRQEATTTRFAIAVAWTDAMRTKEIAMWTDELAKSRLLAHQMQYIVATRRLADSGNTNAMYNLALRYQTGEGTSMNKAEAMKWYHKAADAGNSLAMNDLGVMYYNGDGTPVDKAEALKWYRKAAETGESHAMYNLGVMCFQGDSTPVDKVEALKWYRKAADAGYAAAMNKVGWMYFNGDGTPVDKGEAIKWYQRAADGGDPRGMFNLGLTHFKGDGTPEDKSEARKWITQAAVAGFDPARKMCTEKGWTW